MKIIISFMLVLFTFNTYAISPFAQEFKQAIDEFQFGLTVEWDQKDLSVRNEITKELLGKIRELRAKGMTSKEFQDVLKSKGQNPPMPVSYVKDVELVNEAFKNSKSYARGASWNGEAVLTTSFILATAAVLFFIFKAVVNQIKDPGENSVCKDYAQTETCSESCYDTYDNQGTFFRQECSTLCYRDCLM
jgi:hypothetical protein